MFGAIRLEKISTAKEFFEFIVVASESPSIVNRIREILANIGPTPASLPEKISFDICSLVNLTNSEVSEDNFVSIQANRKFLGGRYARLSAGNRNYGRGKGKSTFVKAE